MHELKIRLKSGKELNVFCKEYEIETSNMTGALLRFKCDNAHGELPLYISLADVECITKIVKKKDEEGIK